MTHIKALTRQDTAPAKAASDSKLVWTNTVVDTISNVLGLYEYSTALIAKEDGGEDEEED